MTLLGKEPIIHHNFCSLTLLFTEAKVSQTLIWMTCGCLMCKTINGREYNFNNPKFNLSAEDFKVQH